MLHIATYQPCNIVLYQMMPSYTIRRYTMLYHILIYDLILYDIIAQYTKLLVLFVQLRTLSSEGSKLRNYTNKTNNLSSRGFKVCNYTNKTKKNNSQRVLELSCTVSKSLQDSLRIVFFCFFSIVTHFGASGTQIIGFIGIVTHFELHSIRNYQNAGLFILSFFHSTSGKSQLHTILHPKLSEC